MIGGIIESNVFAPKQGLLPTLLGHAPKRCEQIINKNGGFTAGSSRPVHASPKPSCFPQSASGILDGHC